MKRQDILIDIMSPKQSLYRFDTAKVKLLILARGGLDAVARALRTTTRTLRRTIANESLNGRLQRELVAYLNVPSATIGYRARKPSHQQAA
jgi:hypothetical protein